MADIMTREQRSERMSRVRNKNSRAEKLVRSVLHGLGYRFRLHVAGLPGSPDIVLPKHRTVILVHGCYWHRHGVCRQLTIPASNPAFWRKKFAENKRRDQRTMRALQKLGWRVLVIWECQAKNVEKIRDKVQKHLSSTKG
jgi:DNA mismatch endonuclease, patch repair protein